VADELDHLAASLGLRWRLEERAARSAAVELPELTVEAQWVETTQLATEKRKAAAG
jgi:hypothetical protein